MLDASDVNCIIGDIFDFLSTDEPVMLTPSSGGTPITFMHGLRSGDVEDGSQSPAVPMEIIAWTKEPLCMGGTYTYNSHTWTVTRDNHHKAGGQNATYSYLLTRHRV